MYIKLLAIYLYVAGTTRIAESQGNNTTTGAHELWYELFVARGYNYKIRPVIDVYDTTDVTVELYLKTIINFDEVSEILKLSAYMFIEWYDEFLVWNNASDFDDISLIRWPQGDVWRPDLTLYNSVNTYKALGHDTILVENSNDGYVSWAPMEVFESSCPVDMTYYPFDIQTCKLEFMSWSYTNDEVTLISEWDHIITEDFGTNPQWEILSTSAFATNESAGVGVDLVVFTIRMKRKPQYLLLTLFLPILLLAVLNIFAFALPSDGGERSGYAVTVFLAFAVFLTILETTMPANSEKVSLFYVYVMIQAVQSTLITVITLCVIRCAALDESTKIPWVLTKITKLSQCACRCRRTNIAKIDTEKKDVDLQSVTGDDGKGNDPTCNTHSTCTWKMVAGAVDKICFILFSTFFIVYTVIGFAVLSAAPK